MKPVAHAQTPFGQALLYRTASATRALGLYRVLLSGPRPCAPMRPVADPWGGDAAAGRSIVSGRLSLAGTSLTVPVSPWDLSDAPLAWRRAAHSFSWLSDLAAAGGEDTVECARAYTESWLALETSTPPGANRMLWNAAVTGQRVRNWLYHWPFLMSGGTKLADRILESLGRQIRHLSFVAGSEGTGADRLAAISGFVHASVVLSAFRARMPRAIGMLERELFASILPDGCHATRSPRIQFEVLRDLVALRDLFRGLHEEVPIALVTAIDRMAPVLRFFRHGDGGLALFNDTREGDATVIDAVLGRSDARGRAPARCPHGGFERLSAGKLSVLVDSGAPPDSPYDDHAHAGPLSLEIAYGTERLIVNCGAARTRDGEWIRAQRTTAAHSTLGVEDTNADAITTDGRIGRRRASTVVERNEDGHAVWVDMSHDGYARLFGLTHRRRLYLAPEGNDLRGEDSLTGEEGHTFTLRFHLHPKVQVSLLANHASALLKTPSGSGWRLRINGAAMTLTDSVYLGSAQETKRTQQILLTGVTGPDGVTVKWALQRETKR